MTFRDQQVTFLLTEMDKATGELERYSQDKAPVFFGKYPRMGKAITNLGPLWKALRGYMDSGDSANLVPHSIKLTVTTNMGSEDQVSVSQAIETDLPDTQLSKLYLGQLLEQICANVLVAMYGETEDE